MATSTNATTDQEEIDPVQEAAAAMSRAAGVPEQLAILEALAPALLADLRAYYTSGPRWAARQRALIIRDIDRIQGRRTP